MLNKYKRCFAQFFHDFCMKDRRMSKQLKMLATLEIGIHSYFPSDYLICPKLMLITMIIKSWDFRRYFFSGKKTANCDWMMQRGLQSHVGLKASHWLKSSADSGPSWLWLARVVIQIQLPPCLFSHSCLNSQIELFTCVKGEMKVPLSLLEIL